MAGRLRWIPCRFARSIDFGNLCDRIEHVRRNVSTDASRLAGYVLAGKWQADCAGSRAGSRGPSTLGTYAIALSMFAEMFRQTPADLPATFSLANGRQIALDPVQVRAVQQGAWQAHLQFGRAGK